VPGSGLAGAGERRGADYSVMAQVLDDITTQATNEAGIRKAGISAACFGIALIAGTYCNCLGQMEESLPYVSILS